MKTCTLCGEKFENKDEFVTHEIDKDGARTRFMSIAFISVGSDGKDFIKVCPACVMVFLVNMKRRIRNALASD
ncbi:MAG: hypothetical protein JRL30_01025 [Deltaproteobacteria bacterium]|nr:hypothetical protein [Deltaproteobacteria bacterium]